MEVGEMIMRVEMSDGSVWAVPVEVIAVNRARHYAHEFGGSVVASLEKDTVPLFNNDQYDARDWAENNMDWTDVQQYATKVEQQKPVNYQEGWTNGQKQFSDGPVRFNYAVQLVAEA